MTVPDDAAASWRVRYDYPGDDYLRDGYYGSAGTTWNFRGATLLAGEQDHVGIDLTLLTGNTITGTVSLPSGQTAPAGGIDLQINANDDNNGGGNGSSSFTIPAGSSSGAYTMPVPDDAAASWRIRYDYSGDDYLQRGYYGSAGTTWNFRGATLLAGGLNHAGIDLTLLTGNTITGTVSLPSGQTAPAGGISVSIYAYDYRHIGNDYSSSVTILAGSSSEAYTMAVPDDAAASWRVSYSYLGNDYLHYGSYGSAGTTWNFHGATLLAGGQDHAGIDLTLLTGNTITGTVSLPSGQTAFASGINVTISANDDNNGGGYGFSWITIPAGSSSGAYSMTVPDNAAALWRVRYSYLGNCLHYGYYTSAGTTGDFRSATLLAGGKDHAGIDLTILCASTDNFPWNMFLPAIIGRATQ